MSFADGMDAGSLATGAEYLTRPAEEYVNDVNVESMWVMRAIEYADIHFNLISSVDPKLLKLTKLDDERILNTFQRQFPDFDVRNVTQASLKSEEAKEKWREFCDRLKDIEDYSYGTLLRLNHLQEYTEENTILVTRIQFLAIEIARNRLGCNDSVFHSHSFVKPENANDDKSKAATDS